MKSQVTQDFLTRFAELLDAVKAQARKAYRIWQESPAHPGLQFMKVHTTESIYSVRVSLGWRVLGLREGDTMYWFWIGSHAEYDQLLKHL